MTVYETMMAATAVAAAACAIALCILSRRRGRRPSGRDREDMAGMPHHYNCRCAHALDSRTAEAEGGNMQEGTVEVGLKKGGFAQVKEQLFNVESVIVKGLQGAEETAALREALTGVQAAARALTENSVIMQKEA